MMQFHAESQVSYRCGNYRVVWGVMGWTAWNYAKRAACLARDVRLAEAMEACEQDAKCSELQAEFVK